MPKPLRQLPSTVILHKYRYSAGMIWDFDYGKTVFSAPFFQHMILPKCQCRHLDTEKLLAYRAVSISFLSMGPYVVIPTPGITESWWLSSLQVKIQLRLDSNHVTIRSVPKSLVTELSWCCPICYCPDFPIKALSGIVIDFPRVFHWCIFHLGCH